MQLTPRPDHTPPPDSLLPIRTVSALTGVNAVTLRAWERRYGLVKPQRTPKGHRLYSHQDIARIRQIVGLLGQGLAVSQVKPLLDQPRIEPARSSTEEGQDNWTGYREKMLASIENFDEPGMDSSYNEALSLYPVDIVNEQLTRPLLRLLGKRWDKRATGIAEEHFFSLYLRNKLGARIHHLNQRPGAPQLLLACLPGELHETGLLFFAISAIDAGYRVLMLGANTPLRQIPGVLEKQPCLGVVLSGTSKLKGDLLDEELRDLVSHAGVPVFVGGKPARTYHEKIEKSGAICLDETIASSLRRVAMTVKLPGTA